MDEYRRARPPRWERVGTKPPARLQLLREDSCVISAFRAKYADIFEKQTPMLSWTWRIYGIQYVKVDIRTNKPLNVLVRLRLSFSVSLMDWQQTRSFTYSSIVSGSRQGTDTCLLEATNRNGLFYFLVANLLTGGVNMTILTVKAAPITGVLVVALYMLGLSILASFLHSKNITLKFW